MYNIIIPNNEKYCEIGKLFKGSKIKKKCRWKMAICINAIGNRPMICQYIYHRFGIRIINCIRINWMMFFARAWLNNALPIAAARTTMIKAGK